MPFIGQDWRSPGEQWVKTHKGSWERLKLLDNASQFLGFQSSSDSSSLDSDSSISDNETGLTFMMESECSQPAGDLEKAGEPELVDQPAKGVLKENVFLLNSSNVANASSDSQTDAKVQCSPDEPIDHSLSSLNEGMQPAGSSDAQQYTITEFNSTIKRTKNTSIQNIISHYERQQVVPGDALKRLRSAGKASLERQSSFDEQRHGARPPFLKSLKQRHLFPSKSIDQPMDVGPDDEQATEQVAEQTSNPTSRFSFVKKNFEKLLMSPLATMKPADEEKAIVDQARTEKPTAEKPQAKHLTIKQCIRQIDLNTTHQNIIRHLENDVSLSADQQEAAVAAIRQNRSSIELSPANANFKPHCPIIVKNTKEIAGYLSISDAFLKLDFYNAIRDIRRFNYVCKLLHLLITQNLTSLSGCATKFLFNLLEEIAFQVAGNQQNIHVLHTLLRDVQKIMKNYYSWGRPVGSTILWETHLKTIEKICQIVKNIEIKPPPDNQKGFRDLPAELIQLILLQLSDYKDLVNSGQVNDTMKSFLDEQYIWRELCKYHFTSRQIKQFLASNQQNKSLLLDRPIDMRIKRSNADNLNWEKVFHALRKKFGLKEEYADCLFLCRHCRSLFWRQIGHVCSFAQMMKEMNKELNKENATPLLPPANENAPEARVRIAAGNQRQHPLIQNQADLNRQINNLNRVNNNINLEINRQPAPENAGEENRFVPKMCDSIPITPEHFLKFFSL